MSLIKIRVDQETIKTKYKETIEKLTRGERFEDFSVEELLYSIVAVVSVADDVKLSYQLRIIRDLAEFDFDDIKYRPIVEVIEGLQFLEKEKIIEILEALIQFEIMSDVINRQLKRREE